MNANANANVNANANTNANANAKIGTEGISMLSEGPILVNLTQGGVSKERVCYQWQRVYLV